ncbi:hypothetical protein ACJJTC_004972 [Scirpophaga incertulas]
MDFEAFSANLYDTLSRWRCEMRKDMSIMKDDIIDTLSSIQNEIGTMRAEYIQLKQDVASLREEVQGIQAQHLVERQEALEVRIEDIVGKCSPDSDSKLSEIFAKIDVLEQQARSCNLEICNVPDKRNESLPTLIEKIGNVLKCPVRGSEVISIHRTTYLFQMDEYTEAMHKIFKRCLKLCRGDPGETKKMLINKHNYFLSEYSIKKLKEKYGKKRLDAQNALIRQRESVNSTEQCVSTNIVKQEDTINHAEERNTINICEETSDRKNIYDTLQIVKEVINPIVHTTRLDDMNIFKTEFNKLSRSVVINAVEAESKPKVAANSNFLVLLYTNAFDTCDYEKIEKNVEEMNTASPSFPNQYITNINEAPRNIDEIINDIKTDDMIDIGETVITGYNNTYITDNDNIEEADKINIEETNSVYNNKTGKYVTEETVNIDCTVPERNIEDAYGSLKPLSIVLVDCKHMINKYLHPRQEYTNTIKVTNINSIIRTNVIISYVILKDDYTNSFDIFNISKNYYRHFDTTSNYNSVIKRYIDASSEVYEISNCCWHKKEENLKNILKINNSKTLQLLTTPHNCKPFNCCCCCKPVIISNMKSEIQFEENEEELSLSYAASKIGNYKMLFKDLSQNQILLTLDNSIHSCINKALKFCPGNNYTISLDNEQACPKYNVVRKIKNPHKKCITGPIPVSVDTNTKTVNLTIHDKDTLVGIKDVPAHVKNFVRFKLATRINKMDDTVIVNPPNKPINYINSDSYRIPEISLNFEYVQHVIEQTNIVQQQIGKTQDPTVFILITGILEKFKNVKLFLNEAGKITAELNMPVDQLTTDELHILSIILTKAQEQVNTMDISNNSTILNFATPLNGSNISNNIDSLGTIVSSPNSTASICNSIQDYGNELETGIRCCKKKSDYISDCFSTFIAKQKDYNESWCTLISQHVYPVIDKVYTMKNPALPDMFGVERMQLDEPCSLIDEVIPSTSDVIPNTSEIKGNHPKKCNSLRGETTPSTCGLKRRKLGKSGSRRGETTSSMSSTKMKQPDIAGKGKLKKISDKRARTACSSQKPASDINNPSFCNLLTKESTTSSTYQPCVLITTLGAETSSETDIILGV